MKAQELGTYEVPVSSWECQHMSILLNAKFNHPVMELKGSPTIVGGTGAVPCVNPAWILEDCCATNGRFHC